MRERGAVVTMRSEVILVLRKSRTDAIRAGYFKQIRHMKGSNAQPSLHGHAARAG
jgi:hypothetical protein